MSRSWFRLLVADVDGTLIGRNGHVSPRVRAAIRDAIASGVLVTLATGRWFRSARLIADELGIALPVILHNGALVKDCGTGEVLDHCHLPRELAEQAIRVIRRHGLQPIVYGNAFDGELVMAGPAECDSSATARYLGTKTEFLRRVRLDDFRLEADPLQLAVADDATRADPLIRDLTCDLWRTVTSMTIAAPDARFVEVLNAHCSKAAAVVHLADRFGVVPEEIMAIGDNFNDLEMLEAAGFGVAMGNAPRGVRVRADWVAPSVNDDGLAVAIERFVLAGELPVVRGAPAEQAGQDQTLGSARGVPGRRLEARVEMDQEDDRFTGRPVARLLEQDVDAPRSEAVSARAVGHLVPPKN